jgi:hypothetical protein
LTRVDGREDQRVAAAVGQPPDPDPLGIDLLEGLGEGDRVAVVLDLQMGVDVLAARAVAVPEVAVVEQDGGVPGAREHLRVGGLDDLLHVAPAPRHHHDGEGASALVGRVEPAPHRVGAARELDVAAHRQASMPT